MYHKLAVTVVLLIHYVLGIDEIAFNKAASAVKNSKVIKSPLEKKEKIEDIFDEKSSSAKKIIVKKTEKVSDLDPSKEPSRGTYFNQKPDKIRVLPASIKEVYYMGIYSSLSYCTDTKIEKLGCKSCNKLSRGIKKYSSIEDLHYGSKGIALIDPLYKKIVLVFRGSVNINNWIQNLEITQTKYPGIKNAYVHKGFYETTLGLKPLYIQAISELFNDPRYKNYNISIVGHSLGGAIAMLATLDLHSELNIPWQRMSVFTYGQPRIGNIELINFINQLPIELTRVVNENDFVPHIIPDTRQFVHHGTEMYVTDNKTVICRNPNSFEDIRCSQSRFPDISILAHNRIWDYPTGERSC